MSSITHVVEGTDVLNRYEYDAWGNTTVCEETVENRFKFNGQQLDPITQQYYLRARFYNPVITRFTQEDTYRGDGLNLYAYCANNPVYYVDPSGHWCDRKEKVYKDLLQERGITEADLANDPDLKLSLMAEASNIVKSQKRNNSSENQPNAPEASNPNAESRGKSGTYTDTIHWAIHDIEARPEAGGYWGERILQRNPRVDAYELRINPQNESFYLPHPDGGYVQFENKVNNTVQDGKLIMSDSSYYHVADKPEFASRGVVSEAQRQLEAANAANYSVEWLVSDQRAVQQLTELFRKQNMDIVVTYYPE